VGVPQAQFDSIRIPKNGPVFKITTSGFWQLTWLVVSTHLKNISQNGFIFPNFRGENKKYLSCHHLVSDLLLVVFEDFDPRTLARSRIRDHRYRQRWSVVTHPKTSMVSLVVLPRHSNSMHHVDVLHAASGSIARSALPGERLGTRKWCCSNMEMTQVMKIKKIN